MHFPLSWRWPPWWWVCYAWCTSRIPFRAALQFSVSWGGTSLVRLASPTRDRFGSPRLELGSLLPCLGFHPKSEGYSVGVLFWYAPVLPLNASTLARCCAPAQPSRQALGCALLAATRTTPMVPLCRDQGARFIGWLLAPVKALPWPVRPLVAWRASHHWADLFGPLS
ncbi:hypothetical protein V6N13_037370 [Hibiscus sabdariffa]|uniref:Secreted protein n=1 Tax=Hibiscus sabdariffa TaxID=183260 RepID=A0ABR2E941_9ROSI